MGNVNSSAGVYITEQNKSGRVAAASTSIGVLVSPSKKGPVMQRTLNTSTQNFLDKFGDPDANLSFGHHSALAFLLESNALYFTRVARNALYGGAVCKYVNNFNFSSPFLQGYADPVTNYTFSNNELFIVCGKDQGVWNNKLGITLYPAKPADSNDDTFWLEVYEQPSTVPVERFLCSFQHRLDGFGKQLFVEEVVNRRSTKINIKVNENATPITNLVTKIINAVDGTSFAFGNDGDPITESDIINAWDLYSDVEEVDISIAINGGFSSPAVQLKMDTICQRRMDCVAVLDMPTDYQNVADALTYRRTILNLNSTYSAIYTPDFYIADTFGGQRIFVPPSGYVAAIYAKTDSQAAVWNAPAGMNRGNLEILGLRNIYNQGDRDALDQSQINAMRVIRGAGIKVWGSSTLATQASALSEISVRRLMIFLEKSIANAAIYSVFEQNTIYLRATLTDMCGRFLGPVKHAGGIYDFNVICNDTNNTPDVIASGDVILDVYIDPVLPIKRIHLNAIIARTGGIAFSLSQSNQ